MERIRGPFQRAREFSHRYRIDHMVNTIQDITIVKDAYIEFITIVSSTAQSEFKGALTSFVRIIRDIRMDFDKLDLSLMKNQYTFSQRGIYGDKIINVYNMTRQEDDIFQMLYEIVQEGTESNIHRLTTSVINLL